MGLKKLKCKKCGDIIESMSHYDLKKCSCGACAVDGGDDYFRFLANEGDYKIITQDDGTEYYDAATDSVDNNTVIEYTTENGDEYIICDFIEEESNVTQKDSDPNSVFEEVIREAMLSLTDREQEVIRFRLGLDDGMPRSIDEVEQKYNISKERVRQIEAKALRKAHWYPRRERNRKKIFSE